jgi:hypothetical protein
MSTTADAFNTLKADIQPVTPDSLSFCDGAEAPAGVDIAQVPSFQDTYIRYEFHPLVSASLWIADRLTRMRMRTKELSQVGQSISRPSS